MKSDFLDWVWRHRWLLFGGLALYLLTALSNVGIIASDDYEFGIARIVPAQNWSWLSIIEASGIRSPIPNLFLFAFTSLAFHLGFEDPVTQLKFALFFVGLMTYLINAYFAFRFSTLCSSSEKKSLVSVFLLSFYFICPMIFTRPLIENLSAPFVLWSAYYACAYVKRPSVRSIVLSVLGLMLAGIFRFQTGVCVLALGLAVLSQRRLNHLAVLALCGVAAYFLSGAVDAIYKGGWHASLFAYTEYQRGNIHRFGAQPAYVFILLFIALSFPPALFQCYRQFSWRDQFQALWPAILYFVFFVLAHTVVVHKEERFMVPVLPLFFVLITPLALYTWENSRWRLRYFMGLNFLLLPLGSFNTPQNNLISAARWVHRHPQITTVVDVGDCLFNFPVAFISHPVVKTAMPTEAVAKGEAIGCDRVLAVRQDVRESIKGMDEHYALLGVFRPGLPEQWVIALNPKQNRRRGPIELYGSRECTQ